MKIYVVAHENIIIPEEYSKVEIEKEEVVHYIKKCKRGLSPLFINF